MTVQTEELLQELYRRYRTLLESYAWEWEGDRWSELVFCLVWRFGKCSETQARTAVRTMADLNLINIADLSAVSSEGTDAIPSTDNTDMMASIMHRCGIDRKGTSRSMRMILHVAQTLQSRYQGKIQLYLRTYGEQMIAELPNRFAFPSDEDEEDIRYAFSVWLQNTLNMPVPAWDGRVERFCQQFEIDPADLLSSADNQDMNVAILDDLIEQYMDEQAEESLVSEGELP